MEKLKQDLDPDGSAVGHVNSHLSHLSRLSKPSRQGRVRKSGGKPSSAKKMQAADLLGALDITPSQERESPYDVFRANSFDRSNRSEQDDSYETDTGLFDSRPWHERFASRLQSTAFEGIIAVALLLNVLWMAAQLQVHGGVLGDALSPTSTVDLTKPVSTPLDPVFMAGDTIFATFFAIEVMVRIIFLRIEFWKVWSNYVDVVVSAAAIFQVALEYTNSLPINLGLLRLIRIGKLARPIRMITMTSVLASLQLLIKCVAGSTNILFWSMCLLFFLQCVAGMVLGTLCRDYIADPGYRLELRQEVFAYYGTFTRAILTMFEVLFATGQTGSFF